MPIGYIGNYLPSSTNYLVMATLPFIVPCFMRLIIGFGRNIEPPFIFFQAYWPTYHKLSHGSLFIRLICAISCCFFNHFTIATKQNVGISLESVFWNTLIGSLSNFAIMLFLTFWNIFTFAYQISVLQLHFKLIDIFPLCASLQQ